MTDKAIWSERVSEWRSSGLSSPAFCKGKSFTAGGLRYYGTGMCLFYKRLDRGTFRLPAPLDEQGTTVALDERALNDLLTAS